MSPTINKTGLPPGTVVYSGYDQNEDVMITLIEFNEKEFIEKEFTNFDECMLHVKPDMVKWINVDGIHNSELIQHIGEKFNIHTLTLEDISHTDQRPKFEEYDNYLVSIMKMLSHDSKTKSEQLSVLLMDKNTVLSFQEVHGGDAFDLIRTRLRSGKGRVRKMGADYLTYCLLDAVVDFYFVILEKVGDRIEDLEEDLVGEPSKQTMKQLHSMKREMIFLRKAVWPLREMINNFERSESKLITKPTRLFLRDVYDHTIRVIDTVESFRDLLSGMMDLYLSSVSNRMNEIMKVLTIITTIFIPLSFIAGVYGMNFKYMPELNGPNSYFYLLGIMLVIAISMIFYFKKKKWL